MFSAINLVTCHFNLRSNVDQLQKHKTWSCWHLNAALLGSCGHFVLIYCRLSLLDFSCDYSAMQILSPHFYRPSKVFGLAGFCGNLRRCGFF